MSVLHERPSERGQRESCGKKELYEVGLQAPGASYIAPKCVWAGTQVSGHEFIRAVKGSRKRPLGPVGFFLLAEISGTIRIVLGLVGQPGFDRIIVNVCAVLQEAFAVPDALVGKAWLPDFKLAAQFLFRAIREISFHEPDCSFNRPAAIQSELQMEMIGHHDEVMQPEPFGDDIGSQNVDKEVGHAFGLQECPADIGFRGHKESAWTVLNVVTVCVARRPCHARALITLMPAWANIYARFALLRAGLRRKEGALFCVLAARVNLCPDTCTVDGHNHFRDRFMRAAGGPTANNYAASGRNAWLDSSSSGMNSGLWDNRPVLVIGNL
jgi:hypothetical protein